MKLKWIFLLLIIVPVVIVLALIGKNYAVNTYRDWKYAPTINPKPKYFMTVKVNIDAALKKNITVDLNAIYETNNLACKGWPNGQVNEGGVKVNREKITTYKIKSTDTVNQLENSISLDKFRKGSCDWNASYFYYNFQFHQNNYGDFGVGLNNNYFSAGITTDAIQGAVEKSKQDLQPNIKYQIVDSWYCSLNGKCRLKTEYQKSDQYIYLINYYLDNTHD
ncbi:MAG: hypothetical protein EXR81_04950 [Gammaproteobacteria bacterium]|nr:hypothetical protein [Gammaproteobacteria bacterium]